jgi:cyclophilin family peptidyl-prolyl cis-trans isomerase
MWRKSIGLVFTLVVVMIVAGACGMPGLPAAAPGQATEAAAEEAPASDGATVSSATVNSGAAASLDPAARDGMFSAAPEMTIDPAKFYYATLKTDKGDIKVQLYADRAPMTVNNFVFLAREGFYDNTTFHRVIEEFMAQAGDPTGTGMGGPGYTFADEFWPGATFDRRGLLAMANAGPGTNGSQFFITFAPTPWLDGGHTIFGEVLEGDEVLSQLTLRDPMADADQPGDLITTILIEEGDVSLLPTPTALPPTPTPFPPTNMEGDRPLADLPGDERVNFFNTAPDVIIDDAKTFTATISTSQGDLVVALFADEAPIAVNNFVVLANLGFYDDTPVNDVSPDQLVVIGSPNNDPASDVGYVLKPETGLSRTPEAGAVAYRTLTQDADGSIIASGSQLFLAIAPPPADVNDVYSFFGQVVEGVDILSSLTVSDTIQSIMIVEE